MALAATAALAGGSAIAAYLNGKYHLRKDLETILRLKRAEAVNQQALKDNQISSWYQLADQAAIHDSALCLWSRQGCYSFRETHDLAAKYAQWFLSQGVRPGDLVGIYLQNSPEFIVIWFGLICIGAAPAFLNWNLEGKALHHCLDIAQTKLLLVDMEDGCLRRIDANRKEIEEDRGIEVVVLDENLKQEVAASELNVPGDEYRVDVQPDFPACLIYTSGTTGLPKGCAITTARMRLGNSHKLKPPFNQTAGRGGDRWYVCMPLYHGTGGITSFGCIIRGISVAIARKFSVSNFWKDVHDSESTFFIYVGETARYLLNAPKNQWERDHKARCAYGNGMRPDVWERFRTRFNVPEIIEFFNSTEGMFALMNWDRGEYQAACVGHHGAILRRVFHNWYIPVLVDHDTGDVWRDPKTGFGRRATYSEGGEMLVRVTSEKAFQGYWRAPEATDKKFIRDVFQKGDIFYRTGDALRRTDDGRWYFMDRLGDTFRWKSENVSTAEVAEVLGHYPGIAEANVYGVLLPNHDGRAGCAALNIAKESTGGGDLDYTALYSYLRSKLPRYAIPLFLRIVETTSHIHNNKQNKVPLRKEGVDPQLKGTEVKGGEVDRVLWAKPGGGTYVEFTREDWEGIVGTRVRL